MDIINYALSKKIKKYVDDISSSSSNLIVRGSDSDPSYATHSSNEIYEAFQNGKMVFLYLYGYFFQLFTFEGSVAVFSSTASFNGGYCKFDCYS